MKILMFVMVLFLVGEIIFLSLYFIDDKVIIVGGECREDGGYLILSNGETIPEDSPKGRAFLGGYDGNC